MKKFIFYVCGTTKKSRETYNNFSNSTPKIAERILKALGLVVVATNSEDIKGMIIKPKHQSVLLGYTLRPKPRKVMF